MNLKKINELISVFKKDLLDPAYSYPQTIYEIQQNWQNEWDLEQLDFYAMYNSSLENRNTRRFWVGENYEPKKMMLEFIKMEKEFVREMFRDLFNTEKDLMSRMDRFVFHCDSLLEEYKSKNRSSIVNRHFHDDGYKMVSLYLSMEYPDSFAYFDRDSFERFLAAVDAKFVAGINDIERYSKVAKIVFGFMQKDPEFMAAHFQRIT
ncbi:MAG: hypothetical protein R2784_08335 [Saprospiraceae bacterium]